MNHVVVSIANWLARVGYVIAAALALYMFAPSARADVLSDFLSVYKQIEGVVPAGTLPLKSQDVEASKGLLACMGNGSKNPVVCVDNFHDTPLGQQASDSAGIPTTFWQLVDVYIAYASHDYWGVAYHLGSAATCAVVQVLMGGIDACSLIEEVVALAKDVYEGGKAVAEFFADVGTGAYSVAKGAYCATLGQVFGGCSGGGGSAHTPKAVAIYDTYFKPNLSYGLNASKSDNNNTLPQLVKAMKSQALAKGHAATDVDAAASVYYQAVDVLWSEFVLSKLLPNLTQARGQYNDPAHVNAAGQQAWKAYVAAKANLPTKSVPSQCDDHFNTLGYGQFTRWVYTHAQKALDLKLLTVHRWCDEAFWKGNQGLFQVAFRGPGAAGSVCPSLGCPTQQALALCQPFMATVGKTCVIAASLPDASAKVDDHVVLPPTGPAKWPSGGGTVALVKPALTDPVPPSVRAASAATLANASRIGTVGTTNASRASAALTSLGCTAAAGDLRFACATRTGFERCEALRARHEVNACASSAQR